MDLHSFLVSLYVQIDDWWKANHLPATPRPGRPALLSASELLTLAFPQPSGPASAARGTSGASHGRTFAPTSRGCCAPKASSRQARPSPGARVAPLAAGLRRGAFGAIGGLARLGHEPHPGHREGEGLPQGALRRAGELRAQRLQDRVGLRLQGGAGGRPRGRDQRFRAGRCGLRREAYRGRPHSFRAPRILPGR
jgi:hypothetical protein